jgi:hypothetical protein
MQIRKRGGNAAFFIAPSSWPGKSAKRVFAHMSRPSTSLRHKKK